MANIVYGRVIASDYTFGRSGSQPRPVPRGSFVKLTGEQLAAIETRLQNRAGFGRDTGLKSRGAIERVKAEDTKGHFVYDLTGGAAESEPAKQ